MATKTTLQKVKPNPAKKVNGKPIQVDHPFQTGRKINTNGEEIQSCDYITRRIKDGDLIDMNAKPSSKATGTQSKEKVKPTEKPRS